MYVRQTRAKLVFFGCGVFLIEGVLKMLFPAFPVVEVLSFQSGLLLAYVAGKSYSDGKESEFCCGGVGEGGLNGESKKGV